MTDDGPQTEKGWVKLHRSALAPNSSYRKLRLSHRAIFDSYLLVARYRLPFRGCLCTAQGKPFSLRHREEILGCDKATLSRADQQMIDLGLLTRRETGVLHITNYDKYQAERVSHSSDTEAHQVSHLPDSEGQKVSHLPDSVSHLSDKSVSSGVHSFEDEVSDIADKEEDAFHPQVSDSADSTPEKAFDGIGVEEIILPREVSEPTDSEGNGLPAEPSAERDAKKVVRKQQEHNTAVRTTLSDETADDLRQRLCVILIERGVRPEATAQKIAADCQDDKLEDAIAWADYVRDHPDEFKNPPAYLCAAIRGDYPVPEEGGGETGITMAQAAGNAQVDATDWTEWNKGYDKPRLPDDVEDETLPALSAKTAFQQAVHNVQFQLDNGEDLETALYRLGNVASQPWSDDFKQQIRAKITLPPEITKPGLIKRELGELGGAGSDLV